jgi:hypothetical protein
MAEAAASFADLADALFALSPEIRYLALGCGQEVQLRERPGLSDSSSSESDRYEELFVNPALLTLARQRGELDCGGLNYLVVAYGSFFQLILPRDGAHASVAIAREADPIALVRPIRDLLERHGDPFSFLP